MKRDLRSAFRWSAFAVVACCAIGCRIDDGGNPSFHDDACDAGTYRGFCLPPDQDPSHSRRDAAPSDASDVPMQPSTPGKPCALENEERLCYDGKPSTQAVGKCTSGIQRCIDEHWSQCAGQVVPEDETCNGDDDDCDGQTDEGAQGDCVDDATGCKGELSCRKGKSVCSAPRDPETETCNGRDDDCDGDIDEDSDQPCTADNPGCSSDDEDEIRCTGICTAGVRRCEDGALVDACDDQVLPTDERCDTGALAYDDDCDGKVDEDCACSGNSWRGCYIASADPNTGAMCRPGRQDCADGTWGTCTGAATPHAEKCPGDGIDDDCNGIVDDVKGDGDDCVSSRPGRCRNGKQTCRGDELICETPSAVKETCNGVDDDCNGETDEGYDLKNDRNHCGKCSTKCAADRECCDGECVDLKNDRDNCTMCGVFCDPIFPVCCDGSCTSFKSDHENCGECGHACDENEQCCGGDCVDVMTDEDYCGSCLIPCDEDTQTCIEGVCTAT